MYVSLDLMTEYEFQNKKMYVEIRNMNEPHRVKIYDVSDVISETKVFSMVKYEV